MSTLFDSYVDPDIPGIFTSVTDNSIAQETDDNSRKVLIIGPSKFGPEEILVFSSTAQLAASLGTENTFKYGKGQFYAKSFIEAGATVLFKRLTDETATYSNQIIFKNEDTTLPEPFNAAYFNDVFDKDTLITPNTSEDANPVNEDIKSKTVYSLLAKGRGKGYNDLFSVYTSAPEYEKFDADDEGIINYKFNFVNLSIYENGAEVVKKANTVLFSLMDIDPVTKNVISHKTTGANLYVNDIVGASNDYLTAKVNDAFIDEIRQYPNIDAVLADKNKPFLFIESEDTFSNSTLSMSERVFYEVQVDDTVTPSTFRIQRATFTPNRQFTAYPTFEVGGQQYILVIRDDNGTLSIKTSAISNPDAATYAEGAVAYIDGDKAFYTFKVQETATGSLEIVTDKFVFLRWQLYTYLMTYNMMLNGGKDTTSSVGFVNLDGSANIDSIANATYEYIRDNKEIREVIYPKHTFNYIIDWTNSVKVKDIMFLLADRLRRTMHIASCPSVRLNDTGLSPDLSLENDVICREQYLTRSSYNTMLYTSQQNKTHFDQSTRLTHTLPSCFYALLDHLFVDYSYGITEPVANIEKGIIRTTNLRLSHTLYSEDIEKLRNMQINCIVEDGSDVYFIDQRTAYKKTSKLSLGNVVKVLQQLQITIPTRLKPYVQKKETDVAITANVLNEIQEILKPYKVTTNSKDAIFKSVNVKTSFDDNVLTIMLRVTPAGTTEKIQVPIIVEG